MKTYIADSSTCKVTIFARTISRAKHIQNEIFLDSIIKDGKYCLPIELKEIGEPPCVRHEGYIILMDDEKICINGKILKIIYDPEYAFKCQKTQIRIGNNNEFIRTVRDDFGSCLTNGVLNFYNK